LGGEESGRLSHVELEQRLSVEGAQLLRQLFQDHLDVRAGREQRAEAVADAEGFRHGAVETGHARALQTVFGTVTVRRLAYRRRGGENLYPADAALNLPEELHSHGLRALAAIEASRGSFEEAADAVERATGVRAGKRQVEALAQRAAVDFEAFYERKARAAAAEGDVLVLSADGKGIVMRPEALRSATAKAAARSNKKLKTRLSKGEKTNRKRMAEVAAVYDVTPVVRVAADIIAAHEQRAKAEAPKATNKWLSASVVDDAAGVIAAMFDEATRRDPEQQRTWIALVDGACHQIDRIKAEGRRRGVTVTIVVDFVHVMEYLWSAAWSFFSEGDPRRSAGSPPRPQRSWKARPRRLLRRSGGKPPASASIPPPGPTRTAAPTTSSPRRPTSATTRPLPRDGRSPPGSSKAPSATWSRTAST